MTQQQKMFKDNVKLDSKAAYSDFIKDSLKPLGFGDNSDAMFFELKTKLFDSLYDETINSGPSFDAEILFSSIISDFSETFDIVVPTLLTLQRNKEEKPDVVINYEFWAQYNADKSDEDDARKHV